MQGAILFVAYPIILHKITNHSNVAFPSSRARFPREIKIYKVKRRIKHLYILRLQTFHLRLLQEI